MNQDININVTPKRISRKVLLFPIIFFLTYLVFTVLFFLFSPWEYPLDDREAAFNFYLFLIAVHLALLFGYLSAIWGKQRGYYGKWKLKDIIWWVLIINTLLIIPTILFRSSGNLNIIEGILNPGDAYGQLVELRQSDKTPIIEYIRLLFGPFTYMLLPLTIFYWKFMTRTMKFLTIFNIIAIIFIGILTGTNKFIADLVILTPWIIFAAILAGIIKIKIRQIIPIVIGTLIGFTLFLAFFTNTQMTRKGSSASVGYFVAAGGSANYNNFMLRNLPPELQIGMLGLNFYMTQGYFATYLCMKEPFVPMFGVGNSMFLYRQAARILDDPSIATLSYPFRIEKYGWDGYRNWSSIYPWIASDVSFPGTVIIVFFIGRFFALSWLDTLRGENPFAIAMFSLFLIMLYYFPANNQLLQSGEGTIAFIGILLLWLFTRKKYVIRK